jgi:hypothetical protein
MQQPRKFHSFAPLGLLVLLVLGGCSSITGETQQSISVEAMTTAGPVTGAQCELINDKGKWFTMTPGSVVIAKSNQDLVITCQRESHQPGIATVTSVTGAGMAGNVGLALLIPIVGIVGAVMDHNSGAVYKYPPSIQIIMGQTIAIDGANMAQNGGVKPAVAAQQASAPATMTTISITEDGAKETVGPLPTTAPTQSAVPATALKATVSQEGLDAAKNRCLELGIKPQTESFGECILRFTK